MNFLYIVAFAGIALIAITLFVLMGIGFIQGVREHREHPEAPTYGESFTDQMDTVYTDVWGTRTMYSKTDPTTGKTTYYDPFGTQIGESERRY